MYKQISGYLLVGVIAYFLGTMSFIYAEDTKKGTNTSAEITELTKKIDKVLANQDEMMTMLKYIRSKTH